MTLLERNVVDSVDFGINRYPPSFRRKSNIFYKQYISSSLNDLFSPHFVSNEDIDGFNVDSGADLNHPTIDMIIRYIKEQFDTTRNIKNIKFL